MNRAAIRAGLTAEPVAVLLKVVADRLHLDAVFASKLIGSGCFFHIIKLTINIRAVNSSPIQVLSKVLLTESSL